MHNKNIYSLTKQSEDTCGLFIKWKIGFFEIYHYRHFNFAYFSTEHTYVNILCNIPNNTIYYNIKYLTKNFKLKIGVRLYRKYPD